MEIDKAALLSVLKELVDDMVSRELQGGADDPFEAMEGEAECDPAAMGKPAIKGAVIDVKAKALPEDDMAWVSELFKKK